MKENTGFASTAAIPRAQDTLAMPSQTNKRPAKQSHKASASARQSFETTQILENVELLIALHESRENETHGELSKLITEFESWKKESQDVDSDAESISLAVESKFGERFDDLDRRVADIAEIVGNRQGSQPNQDTSSGGQDIEAMLELLTDHFNAKTAEIVEAAGQVAQQPHDSENNFEPRSGEFHEKTQGLIQDLELQFESRLDQRFEKLNAHLNKITSALAGQQVLLESGTDPENDSDPSLVDHYDKRIEGVFLSVNARIDDLLGSLGNRISQFADNMAREESSQEVPVAVEDNQGTASHWHRQKTAMLSKYGIDPEYRPLLDKAPKVSSKVEDSELEEVTENLESLHNSIESFSAADTEAIDNLKEELTSQLRDAEIEFSINRAKLSQLKAELDDKQVELERRASALETKYGGLSLKGRKSGFLDRLARHLSLRKPESLGE